MLSSQDITCIVRKYRSQHGVRHAPIIIVYSIVQAIRCLTSFSHLHEETQYLMQVLSECSITWGLATQAMVYIRQSSMVHEDFEI